MALMAHRIETVPDAPDTQPSHIRIKNTLVGTIDSMFWLNRPPRAWDRVTMHIPLNAICIKQRYPGHSRLRPRLLTETPAEMSTTQRG